MVALGLVVSIDYQTPEHLLEYATITSANRPPLAVQIYHPSVAGMEKHPAAIVVQPLNNPPEFSRALALELIQEGFTVLVFDWRGHDSKQNRQLRGTLEGGPLDLSAAVAHLRSLPDIDPAKICLAGHSVGATFAINYALQDPAIVAVASIGMSAEITPQAPSNVLWAVGLFDEFCSVKEMRAVLRTSADWDIHEGETHGDFSAGTARRLDVSPTADHFTELQDRYIHSAVVDWFSIAAGQGATARSYLNGIRGAMCALAIMLGMPIGLLLYRRACRQARLSSRVAPLIALVATLLLSRWPVLGTLLSVDAILFLFFFGLFAGSIATASGAGLYQTLRALARVALIVWLSMFSAFLVNNLTYLGETPAMLLSLPETLLRLPLDWVNAYFVLYARQLLFSHYGPESLSPLFLIYILLSVEAARPGLLLYCTRSWKARRERRASEPQKPRAQQASPWPKLFLVALILLLVVLGAWRFSQGFLTRESAIAAARFMLKFGCLPLVFGLVYWRLIPVPMRGSEAPDCERK